MAGDPQGETPSKLEQILEIVYLHMEGNREKVDRWLRTPHPALAGDQPIEMIRRDQAEKVLAAIQSEIETKEGGG